MALDELLKVIETLRKRAQDPGLKAKLQQEEALTRYVLVDPLLRALGWDTGDPEQVYPEYPVSGRVDYALIFGGKPVMFIEVKGIGGDLKTARAQAITRFQNIQVPYFAITDGLQWEVCDTSKPMAQITVLSFDLGDQDVTKVCLQAASLWTLKQGQLAMPMQLNAPPITSLLQPQAAVPGPLASQSPPIAIQRQGAPHAAGGWVSLSDFRPTRGDEPPTRLRLPDRSEVNIKDWKDLLPSVIRWLVERQLLNSTHCPIKLSRGNRYIVHTVPSHPNGKSFFQKVPVGQLWVETHFSGPDTVRRARFVLQHMRQDSTQFWALPSK